MPFLYFLLENDSFYITFPQAKIRKNIHSLRHKIFELPGKGALLFKSINFYLRCILFLSPLKWLEIALKWEQALAVLICAGFFNSGTPAIELVSKNSNMYSWYGLLIYYNCKTVPPSVKMNSVKYEFCDINKGSKEIFGSGSDYPLICRRHPFLYHMGDHVLL